MSTDVQTLRRFSVSVTGRFEDEAVLEIKKRLERLGTTKVENYDVYPATAKIDSIARFRIESDATADELRAAVGNIAKVKSILAEEINAPYK